MGVKVRDDWHGTLRSRCPSSGSFSRIGDAFLRGLLVRRNALLVLNLRLHNTVVSRLDLQRDHFSSVRLDEYLHLTVKTEDKMKDRLLLDIEIQQSTAILELPAKMGILAGISKHHGRSGN